MNYKTIIQQGISFITTWMNEQEKAIKETEDFKEIIRVLADILQENDFSNEAYEDIRFVLKPFEEILPLKIKRIFKMSRMDHYTMFIASRWFDSIDDFINLEIGVKRFQGNMTKFHYNPISLVPSTRRFFTHLQTLYLYSSKDCLFKEDERIIAREPVYLYKYIEKKDLMKIEEWSGLRCKEAIFDSYVDSWNVGTSVLDKRIVGKKHLAFLIEDINGEKFGYYLNTKVEKEYGFPVKKTDNKSFHFNLESNNRLKQPMKFEIKNPKYAGIVLWHSSNDCLITLGDIELCKENWKNKSFCYQFDDYFNYNGIKKALCGKTGSFEKNLNPFTPKRIVTLQMG